MFIHPSSLINLTEIRYIDTLLRMCLLVMFIDNNNFMKFNILGCGRIKIIVNKCLHFHLSFIRLKIVSYKHICFQNNIFFIFFQK